MGKLKKIFPMASVLVTKILIKTNNAGFQQRYTKVKNILKVTIGEPKAIIQDIFKNNIPEVIIDVEDEEITFNIKKGTLILIKKRGRAKKRKRSEIGSQVSPLQKRCKTSFSDEEAIGTMGFIAKR